MNYGANDIVSLSAGRAFREKIGMYLSADRQEAINLGLRELIVNVQDEYEVYKPKNPKLTIQLFTDKRVIRVIDNMRGIPCGMREDGMNSLTAAFMIPHSGGKHREGAYVSSVGINGEGNKVVCHTAKWLEVTVHRDGSKFYQRFESTDEGATPVCDVVVAGPTQDHTGTEITYQPDAAVYGDIFIDVPALERMLQEMSYFTKGLTIELIVDGVSKTFYSANGLVDGLVNPNAIGKPFSYFYDNGECKVELALQWVTKRGSIKGYANGLYMPNGGAFISGFKTSLTKAFNNLAKSSFDGESIRAMVDGFVSVKVKVGQFSNQAKTALANPEARTATATATTQAIKEWVGKNRSDFDMVVSTLTKIEKAERAAEKARAAVLNHEKEQLANAKRKLVNSDKLRDAKKLGEDSVLLVCEGLSAGGSMSIGRDINKYGILMLRGKAINCLSNSIEDVLENEEVKLMLQALGITYGKPYNSKKLRYGRVAIASDADFDGSHIGLLIMAMLQRLCPEFIQEGRLNWLVPPLYKLAKSKKTWYYYSEDEFQNRAERGGEIVRYKGLGQMSKEDLCESMFNEKWQRMERLVPDADSAELLEMLMGEDVEPRKDFVFDNIDFGEFVYG